MENFLKIQLHPTFSHITPPRLSNYEKYLFGLPRPNPFRHPCKLTLISPLFNQDIILTFCAIGWSTFGDFEWVQMDTYRRIVEINIFGLLQALKKAAPLVRKGKGRIVTVTSGLARSPAASRSSYIITKYGGMGLMECVRYELKRFGVQVRIC